MIAINLRITITTAHGERIYNAIRFESGLMVFVDRQHLRTEMIDEWTDVFACMTDVIGATKWTIEPVVQTGRMWPLINA